MTETGAGDNLVGINNSNQVIGTETSGSNAFVWKDGAKTYLANLIPADYQGELGGISPRLLINSDTSSDGTIHILFDATFTDPTDGSTSQKTYVLNGPAAALSATTCTLQEVQLPDGVNSSDIRCINANGVLAFIHDNSSSSSMTANARMTTMGAQSMNATTTSSIPKDGPLLPVEITVMKPDTGSDADWINPDFEFCWEEDLLHFENPDQDDLMFKVTVPMQVTQDMLKQLNVDVAIHGPDTSVQQPKWVTFNLADIGWVASTGTQICCYISSDDVLKKIMPTVPSTVTQYASLDWVEDASKSNYQDSGYFDTGMAGAANDLPLVNARGGNDTGGGNRTYGNGKASSLTAPGGIIQPWIAPASHDYLVGGGCYWVDIRMSSPNGPAGGSMAPSGGARAICRHQANCLYLSTHGMHSFGEHYGNWYQGGVLILPLDTDGNPSCVYPEEVDWKKGLSCVIIAGCSVLDIDDFNNNYPNPNTTDPASHTDSPGKRWAAAAPTATLLGYNFTAPSDVNGGAEIAAYWTPLYQWYKNNPGFGDAVPAWKTANSNYKAWNACAISSGTYYYFQKTVVLGLPIYSWTSVPQSQW